MKKHFLGTFFLVACGDDPVALRPDAPQVPRIDAPPGQQTVTVPAGDISADTSWTANTTYVLDGQVFVTSGTLTIEPGTRIEGKAGSVLTITQAARLVANGTAAAPIVFTSNAAAPESGDWGGVVILGAAPINVTGGTNLVEGFPAAAGDRISYGGANSAHDCGTLRYARIEYAGFELSTDNELNGLTLAGCGSATQIDYVQVHKGLDDGIEIFGGTVSLRHIVISQADDDALDTDLGWTGTAQFVIVQQVSGRGDRAFEWDSNRADNDAAPRNKPVVWNYTLIGGDGAADDPQGGMHLRRGTGAELNNGIVAYFTEYAVDVDGAASRAQFLAGDLALRHTYFQKSGAAELWPTGFDGDPQDDCDVENANCIDEATAIGGLETNHANIDPMLTDPKHATAPSFAPMAGSPVLSGCGTPSAGFDQTATFCGAIGAVDWTAGWTAFPQ